MTLSIGGRCVGGVVLASDSMQRIIMPGGHAFSRIVRTPDKIRQFDENTWAATSTGHGRTDLIIAERRDGDVQMSQMSVGTEDRDMVAALLPLIPQRHRLDVGEVAVVGAIELDAGRRWWPHPELARARPETVEEAIAHVGAIMETYLAENYGERTLEDFLAEGKSPAVAYPQHIMVIGPTDTSYQLLEAA